VFKAAHLPDPAPRSDVATQEIMISDQLENKDIVKLKEDLQVSQYLAVTETVFFSERRLAGIPVRIVSVAD
jgi:hypothetical protein